MVGLLDLPKDILIHILSFLDTLSLAAVRLACQELRAAGHEALRDAGRQVLRDAGQSPVSIVEHGWYTARARPSPRVLQSIQTYRGLREQLGVIHQQMNAHASGMEGISAFLQAQRFLQMLLLLAMAPDVESFDLRGGMPHVLWPCMETLGRLRLHGRLQRAVLQQLPARGRLTCLQLEHVCSNEDIREIGSMAGLQELALPLPAEEARHLTMLAPLTALSALRLDLWGTWANLGGLASLATLKSLHIVFCGEPEPGVQHVYSLSPLAALGGLTSLHLQTDCEVAWSDTCFPSNVSFLSLPILAALRVLRCSFVGEADLPVGNPQLIQLPFLPIQFRFLRIATALVELDLGFSGSFCRLPPASRFAMREAVRDLRSLKKVTIAGTCPHTCSCSGLGKYFVPLDVFAAASSIESFALIDLAPSEIPLAQPSTAEARGCFTALTKLRSLTLVADHGPEIAYGHIPHCEELLEGLPSTGLTSLTIAVNETPMAHWLMREIARFSDLQELSLGTLCFDDLFVMEQLSSLRCLTFLKLHVNSMRQRSTERWHRRQHGAHVPAIWELAVLQKQTIVERARLVGVPAKVEMIGFDVAI